MARHLCYLLLAHGLVDDGWPGIPERLPLIAHHFVGGGIRSGDLRAAGDAATGMLAAVTARVQVAGLNVVTEQSVPCPGGGATLVWVLAESHVVMHLWPEQDRASLDLHVCDYRASNAEKAERLRDALDTLCFAPGSSDWRELAISGGSSASRMSGA